MKNIKELHYEHIKWLSELALIKKELMDFSRFQAKSLQADIEALSKLSLNLEHTISEHEKTLALAMKATGINDYYEIFQDHEKIRNEMEALNFKISNIRPLVAKEHKHTSI